MIVPIIRRGNLILQHKMSSILSISHCFRLGNQLPHASQCIFLAHRIPLVEDNHGNVMHFPPANAECRQYIEAVFRADALTESKLSGSIFAADRRDGTKCHMSTVGKPVDPVEFTEIGGTAVDVDSGTEVRVFWRVLWEEELILTMVGKGGYFGTLDLEESFLDGIELGISHVLGTLLSTLSRRRGYINTTVVQPATLAHPQFLGHLI